MLVLVPLDARPAQPATIVVGGDTVGLALIRSLGAAGVPVVLMSWDKRDIGGASKWVLETIRSPHPADDQLRFLRLLAELSGRYPGALVMPAADVAVAALARWQRELAAWGFAVAVPPDAVAAMFLDPEQTYATAYHCGVPIPVTIRVREVADIARYAAQASFPAVIKPASLRHRYLAAFGRTSSPVSNSEQAAREYHRATAAGLKVVIQEWVSGRETRRVFYSAYFWVGEPLVEFSAMSTRTDSGRASAPTVAVSRNVPQVTVLARCMLSQLRYSGFANIEFRWDSREGGYKLIKVNAGHPRTAAHAWRCGINFPLLQYRHLVRGERPSTQDYLKEVYWIDGARDIRQSVKSPRRPGPMQFLLPYRSPHVFAVWSGRDPRPSWAQLTVIAGTATISSDINRPCTPAPQEDPTLGFAPGQS